MTVNKRLVYFLVFLVIVLPVITGILVWQLLPKCDNDDVNNKSSNEGLGQQTTTDAPQVTTHIAPPTTADPFGDGPWRNLRLTKNVIPLHYDIVLFPDFYGNQSWFYGNETVELRISEPTSYILIHTLFLNITRTAIKRADGTDIPIKRHFEYDRNQFWVVETEGLIPANTTVFLELSFNGDLKRAIVGFYKSTYFNSDIKEYRSIATTKLGPVAARRAFPCFDEPDIKAQFTLTLVHHSSYTPLSNMPVNNSKTWDYDSSLKVTHFQRSVDMSTYLVCFIVCDFDYIETFTVDNITIRVYAPSDRLNQTAYALEVAKTSVELFTDKFNISYPLPKLDLIPIPDFISGAMENWGLITFREGYLYYDPLEAPASVKQRVLSTVTHEISHQWFGNLVTMAWWDDLWLNEGFASYIEYIGAEKHEPTWAMSDQFLINDLQPVMVPDADLSSHPIVVDVQSPAQISSMFDTISYNKGSSVIRMLKTWMGEDKFFQGVSRYLKQYMFKNARTDDLWEALGKVDDYPVADVMDTWTQQMGFPYINLTMGGSGDTLIAQQHRFLADPSVEFDESESEFRYKWFIKLDFFTNDGVQNFQWMLPNQTSVNIQLPINLHNDNNSWVKLNSHETGFYRVNYPKSVWRRLAQTLALPNQMKLNAADRSNLLDDAFNLAHAGIINYDVALDLTLYLDKEYGFIPWATASGGISFLSYMLEFTGDYGLLQNYMQSKVAAVYHDVGFEDKAGSHLDRLKRSTIIPLACGFRYQPCIDHSVSLFRDWLYNGTIIPASLRYFVYAFGLRQSQSSNDWDMMWEKYKNETDAQEKSMLMAALATTKTTWLLMRYIEWAHDPTIIREQDQLIVLWYIAGNSVGRGLVWSWVREHWEELVNRFGMYNRFFGQLIPGIVSGFNTKSQLGEVNAFFEKYPDAGAGANGRQQALESIHSNIKWMQTNKETVVTWLKQHQPPNPLQN